MATSESAARSGPLVGGAGVEGLDAMAALAQKSGLVVHVIVPRGPGVVEHARAVARRAAVACYADLRAATVRIRFQPNG